MVNEYSRVVLNVTTGLGRGFSAKPGKSSVYYYFDQHSDYPVDSPEYVHESSHAQDVSYLFQHLDANDPRMSKSDLTISETMSDYWVNFVMFGEPNGGSLPQWTPFTNNTTMVMYFANTPHLGSAPDKAQLEGWLDILNGRRGCSVCR